MGNRLKYGKNDYMINVDYYDGLKKLYNANKEFSIELTNVTLFQRLLLWFNGFEITKLRTAALMISITGIIFIVLIGWLWRRGSK